MHAVPYELDRDFLVELIVVAHAQVDGTHAAMAEFPDDPVSANSAPGERLASTTLAALRRTMPVSGGAGPRNRGPAEIRLLREESHRPHRRRPKCVPIPLRQLACGKE